jgi:hypothetical protein
METKFLIHGSNQVHGHWPRFGGTDTSRPITDALRQACASRCNDLLNPPPIADVQIGATVYRLANFGG